MAIVTQFRIVLTNKKNAKNFHPEVSDFRLFQFVGQAVDLVEHGPHRPPNLQPVSQPVRWAVSELSVQMNTESTRRCISI